ncbi:ABC transporter ATP-binding protein [Effusibacillus lacus]|uniref:ABC transporter ATP-binding protein n=1 Tax=Effusibacillus lacus TaxID=1348429 RepID=A0A292YDK2_9BACL|nr:ABC transporter ATP-binding protein [Effusibacillus lacus]TCS72263.1 branched-chain amino acid transport system ATP-binding protein [Effusibacillus lacus]GAX90262.1 ABC transporter ATP-binding protein [Effusibacillus lacus]
MSNQLELTQVDAYYGKIQALRGISLSVRNGEIVTLLGSNGAGKSTTLKTISELVRVRNGSIRFEGEDIGKLSPHQIVDRGIVHVPEGRRVFGAMTVTENLELGSFPKRKDTQFVKRTMEHVFELFPRLKERHKQKAGTLSGGEQQMLAIGRGLMSGPKLLMLDEPSMGLAPIVVQDIMKIIKKINSEGTTVLLVEQNAKAALKLAHTGYVIETGQITIQDTAEKLRQDDSIVKAYLANP